MSGGRLLARTRVLALLASFNFANAVDAHENGPGPAGEATTPTSSLDFSAAAASIDAFHAALSKGDAAAASALLEDDVQIFQQGEVERLKAEYASHHLPSDVEFSRATQSAQTSRTGASLDDIAYVISEGKITGTYKGKVIDLISIETMVLRHHPNGWRIVHIPWSSRRAEPTPPKQ
jgi:ketosteroid isomerase-like protein